MSHHSLRAKTLACALLATTAPAAAQTIAPVFRNLDGNGVDLAQGDFLKSFAEGSIGAGEAELALLRVVGNVDLRGSSQWDNMFLVVTSSGNRVVLGSRQDVFPAATARGATLTTPDGGLTYLYRSADGTTIAFTDGGASGSATTNMCDGSGTQSECDLVPTTITSPDGKTVTLSYDFWDNCSTQQAPDDPLDCTHYWRLASVSNSFGYALSFSYAAAGGFAHVNPPSGFYQRTGAAFTNAVAGGGTLASISYSYPSSGVTDVTDTGGRVWRVTSNGSVYAIRRPGASADTTTASHNTAGLVSSVTNEGVTTNYSRSVSGTTATMTVTDALSHTTTVVSDLSIARPTSVTDANGHTTSYQYDSYARLTRVTAPEGNYVATTYDARGNVTQTQAVAKDGTTTLTTTASYDSTCSNPVTCNQPNSVTDARGNTTDYTYDSTHGGVLTVTAPAPTSGATRPQTRYSYTLTNGEYQLTGVSACRTGSSCTGTSDEMKATLAWDSNGNLTSKTVAAGENSLSATTAMTYDAIGNLLTVDGPLSGSADTTRYRYDAARELVGIVSPDPDGSGSLKNRAVRNTYTNGLLTKTEQGTVNSQSDTDWAAFTALQETDTSYDANARPVTQSLVSGGTTYALTQSSYDAVGRVQCTAQRMSPTYFGSLPSDACTLGSEQTSPDYGPDRIVKATYDNAGQPTKTTIAYGTADQADDVTAAYTDNGKVATVTDAEGNKTSYVYDGFDRVSQVFLPSTTKGAGTSNSSDYQQLTYDANGNVTTRRTRANESLTYSYDALNRLLTKTVPTSTSSVAGYSVYYGYDLIGRMTYARFGSTSGAGISNAYDALGRLTSSSTDMSGATRTVSHTWDLHNNRLRVAHPDGNYASYDYDGLDRVTAVRENGGSVVIACYTYDDSGARTGLSHYGSATTSYGYDAIGRLTSLSHDLTGTSYDQSFTFTYNPAGQIVSRSGSNDSYAWTGHYNLTRGYTANGLNQYTASGSASPTYDGNGNLTSDGTTSFAYDAENHLVGASGGHSATLAYDPLGRLWQLTSGSATTQFVDDGGVILDELTTSGTYIRRFAHGAGSDEPIGWYEGVNAARAPLTDERGTAIAFADSSGNGVAIDTYDEYGIPRSSNVGRFQYTGQAWLPELGLFYYKARFYSPTMGRFMQTDPIGYDDGMNWYNYAGSDPVNVRDPFGLETIVVTGSYNCPPDTHHEKGIGCVPDPHMLLQRSQAFATGEGAGGGGGASAIVTVDKSCNGVNAAHDPKVQAKALEALRLGQTAQQRDPSGPRYREYGFTGRKEFLGNGYVTGDMKEGGSLNVDLDPGWLDTFDVHAHPGPDYTVGPSGGDVSRTPKGYTSIVINSDKVLRCYTGR